MSDLRITTNNVPRDVIDAYELTRSERKQFYYLDWPAIDRGHDSATFFRYRGELYDLGEFDAVTQRDTSERRDALAGWDGLRADSFFSALVVRYVDEYERVVVGLALS